MAITISRQGNLLDVQFSYSPTRISKIKQIKGHLWDRDDKVWRVPYTEENLITLKRLFKNEQVAIDFVDNSRNHILIKKMEKELILKGYSLKTQEAYIKQARRFASFIDSDIENINNETVRGYVLFLMDELGLSHSYVNQAISAIKFLCKYVLEDDRITIKLPRPKKEYKLPNILSLEEVKRIFQAVTNEKHRTILYLVYSGGLRVGEVVRLKATDIDSQKNSSQSEL